MSRRFPQFLQFDDPASRWTIIGIAAVVFLFGIMWRSPTLLGGGAVVLCLVLRRASGPDEQSTSSHGRWASRGDRTGNHAHGHESGNRAVSPSEFLDQAASSGSPKKTSGLVDDLLAAGRYALLLRPAAKQHLTQLDVVRAIRQLDEAMALVPAGRVLLGQLAEQSNSACGASDIDPKLLSKQLVNVAPVYLDRFAVTNEQFQQFIDGGG